ncbi:MAG: PQQ-binding-like beta-propeller repeat protein [Candidatus Baltobacteraceae bacterium]
MIALLLALATGSLDSPQTWTQFRLASSNNAVVRGSLQTMWTLKTAGPFSSSPAIAGGVLYVGNNAGRMYAIDPATGTVKWTARVHNPLMAVPIVYGRLVIVGEGNEKSPNGSTPSDPIHVGSPPNALVAFDRLTGAIVWERALQGSGMPMPAIVDGMLVQHNGAGYVLGVNPADGAVAYARNVTAIASMTAALPLGGGRFATAGVDPNEVLMLRASDGGVIWRSVFSASASGIGDCPAVSDRVRIYCDYDTPPASGVPMQTERSSIFRAYALDAATGKKLWDAPLERGIVPKRNEAAIPLLVHGTLYLGCSLAPYVHALDPATGSVRWRFRAHGPVKGGIVEAGGVLYFGDFGGYLWAVNAKNGSVIGARKMHVPFNVGSPVVAGQTLVIGAANGTLFAMPLAHVRSGKDR